VRRGLTAIVLVAAVASLVPGSTAAASSPPTAKQLVKKLIAADMCNPPVTFDAPSHTATCKKRHPSYGLLTVTIKAYPSKAEMLEALDVALIEEECHGFGAMYGYTWMVVGRTWFGDHLEILGIPLQDVLGGKVTKLDCPVEEPTSQGL
jgi:hypothetical protein